MDKDTEDIYEKIKTEKLESLDAKKKEIFKQMEEKGKFLEDSVWNPQLFNDYNSLIA